MFIKLNQKDEPFVVGLKFIRGLLANTGKL